MARSKEQWELVKDYFELGLTLDDIVKRKGVMVSKSQISKKSKLHGWVKGRNAHLLNAEIETKQKLKSIKKQKRNLSDVQREVFDEIVDERLEFVEFFNKSALRNQHLANEILEDAINNKSGDDEELTMVDLNTHSMLTGRNKQTVLGKDIDIKKKEEAPVFVIRTSATRD